ATTTGLPWMSSPSFSHPFFRGGSGEFLCPHQFAATSSSGVTGVASWIPTCLAEGCVGRRRLPTIAAATGNGVNGGDGQTQRLRSLLDPATLRSELLAYLPSAVLTGLSSSTSSASAASASPSSAGQQQDAESQQ